jgi:hypothetical protein
MGWATFWAIFSQTHLVTVSGSKLTIDYPSATQSCTARSVSNWVGSFVPKFEFLYPDLNFCTQVWMLLPRFEIFTQVWNFYPSLKFLPKFEIFVPRFEFLYQSLNFCTQIWIFVSKFEIFTQVWNFVSKFEILDRVGRFVPRYVRNCFPHILWLLGLLWLWLQKRVSLLTKKE